jgi:hypothetical protein
MTGPRLNAANAIVEANGTMSQQFRTWTLDASLSIPLIGAGSPEGIVTARQYSLYIDSTGLAGSIEYRKMLPDIGGDVTQGWKLV